MSVSLTPSEREFLLERLDREHISEVARNVRAYVENGQPVEACYQPGDATWYSLLFTPLGIVVGAGGGGTLGNEPSSYLGRECYLHVFYSQAEKGVALYPGCDLDYAASKLTESRASALAIAELLREVLDPEIAVY